MHSNRNVAEHSVSSQYRRLGAEEAFGKGDRDTAATDRIERVDVDEGGNLDDVAVSDVSMFRLEFMSETGVWIRLCRESRPDLVISLESDGAICGWCEED